MFGETLKPCPFCGRSYRGLIIEKGDRHECPSCGAMGPLPYCGEIDKKGDALVFRPELATIRAWNVRAK